MSNPKGIEACLRLARDEWRDAHGDGSEPPQAWLANRARELEKEVPPLEPIQNREQEEDVDARRNEGVDARRNEDRREDPASERESSIFSDMIRRRGSGILDRGAPQKRRRVEEAQDERVEELLRELEEEEADERRQREVRRAPRSPGRPSGSVYRRILSRDEKFREAYPNDEVGAEVILHMRYDCYMLEQGDLGKMCTCESASYTYLTKMFRIHCVNRESESFVTCKLADIFKFRAERLNKNKKKFSLVALPQHDTSALLALCSAYFGRAQRARRSRIKRELDSARLRMRDLNREQVVKLALMTQLRASAEMVDAWGMVEQLFEIIANLLGFVEVKEVMPFFLVAFGKAMKAHDFQMSLVQRLHGVRVMEHCCSAKVVLERVVEIQHHEEEERLVKKMEPGKRKMRVQGRTQFCRFGAECKWPDRCVYVHPTEKKEDALKEEQ